MPHHRFFAPGPWPPIGGEIAVGGDEARHAAVKRLRAGEHAELLDGAGNIARGTIVAPPAKAGRPLILRIDAVHATPRPPLELELWTSTPQGDNPAVMIDMLSQLGASVWRPLRADRTVVDPRDAKLERLARVAAESAKQCGRAWFMAIRDALTTDAAVAAVPPTDHETRLAVCDAGGLALEPGSIAGAGALHALLGAPRLIVLIGPEGDWSPRERDLFARRGLPFLSLGAHILRIQTAALAAAALLMAARAARGKTPPAPPVWPHPSVR
ncbi:16S rRNA (uracil(1498)-N(3))-methyltransferase [soil metagenome]